MSPEDCQIPTPEPDAPGEPRLPFADWIEVRASLIRLLDTDAASWLADQVDLLAGQARLLRATSPAEFDARSEVMAGPDGTDRLTAELTEARAALARAYQVIGDQMDKLAHARRSGAKGGA